MSGNKLFIDTNIALYLLAGDQTIMTLLDEKEIYLSVISELELLGYHEITKNEIQLLQTFLNDCKIVEINAVIKKQVIELKQHQKIKLPDAIIVASANYLNIPLLTADKQLQSISDIDLILYKPNEED